MGVKLSAELIARENDIFRTEDINEMSLLLDEIKAEAEEYIEAGAARPYYFLDRLEEYAERAVREQKLNLNAWLLEYKNNNFDFDFIDDAENDLSDLEFEFRDPYLVEKYQVGQKVEFGRYPTTRYADFRPVVWRILDIMGDKALLISHNVLECKRFDEGSDTSDWEKCTLREFLNGEFSEVLFNDEERAELLDVELKNTDNPKFGTKAGNDTVDKVFLLSLEETEQYFVDKYDRKAIGTDFTKTKSINLGPSGYSFWWLRSPGHSYNWAAYIHDEGILFHYGDYIYNQYGGVRPCICVKLSALEG